MQECCAGAVSGNGNTVALGISGANNSSKKKRPKKSHSSESDSESDVCIFLSWIFYSSPDICRNFFIVKQL